VKMMDALTPQQVVAYARRFGLESKLEPFLSLALGAADMTLMDMTSAYSVFPNGGVRMRPLSVLKISDREGNLLEESRPDPQDAIRADTAFVMTNLLRGVVQRGTAASASKLGWPLGGKTGTTDDYGDAWFIGFDPDITVGVWVGHDERKPIGHNETGAMAALPIWIEFMRAYLETRDPKNPPEFTPPGKSPSARRWSASLFVVLTAGRVSFTPSPPSRATARSPARSRSGSRPLQRAGSR